MSSVEALVEERRKQLNDSSIPAGSSELWGVALSGGGIRSATFCLGLLRSLAESGALRRFDIMSTVSGGGYVGSMLGKMLHHTQSKDDVEKVYAALGAAESRWFTWWLRANGRYLIPRGVRDRFFVSALFIRNLIGIHAEVAVATLFACAVLALLNLVVWQAMSVEFGVTLRWFTPEVLSWMPTLWLVAVVPAFLSIVSCCVYWALPTVLEANARARFGMLAFWAVVVIALVVVHPRDDRSSLLGWPKDSWLLWATLLVLAAAWIVALLQVPGLVAAAKKKVDPAGGAVPDDYLRGVLRNQVTESLVNRVAWAFAILLAGLVERLGWFVAFELSGYQGWYGAVLLFIAAVLRMVLPKVAPASGTAKPMVGVPLTWLGQFLGWALAAALLVWWVSIGYSVIFDGLVPGTMDTVWESTYRALLMVLLCGIYIGFTGGNVGFLNSSSLHSFYRARLTRSYLGAANDSRVVQPTAPAAAPAAAQLPAQPASTTPAPASVLASVPAEPKGGYQTHPVSDVLGDDDVAMETYAPHAHGGMVHLLNVCLNETKDHRGGLFNQDRRGQPLTLGPSALARVGLRPWSKLDPTGAMTLGTWMAVSGAALAPGLGSMTRPGLSALITLTGMRLGFWWDNNAFGDPAVRTSLRGLPQKTRVLANEILGRFGLGFRDWYLSDGGHFENTGAYSLLSCRAKLIVVADCGADPLYRFSDLENLIRKARVDLGAEITFLRPKGLRTDPKLAAFGSLSDLKLDTSAACLALAMVRYRPVAGLPAEGVIVIVKPNVSLDLPVDLHNFKADYPEFPQQSTTDQFFSEAQWESYFVLGKVIGSKLGRGVLEDIADVAERCFEVDNGQAIGAALPGKDDKSATPASARLPKRLVGTSVAAASLSVGAAATFGVATWQAIDSVRSARDAKVGQDRAVLKELSDSFGRVGAAPNPDAALPSVASTLLRISDVHCKAEDVAWFHASPAAVCTLRSARKLCESRVARMPSCALLLSSSSISCLDPERRVSNYIPKYWAVELYRPVPVACPTPDADPWAAPVKAEAAAAAASAASAAELAASAARTVELAASKLAASSMTRGETERAAAELRLAAQQAATAASAAAASMSNASVAQASPLSSAASAPPGEGQAAGTCAGYTVYTQIYGGKQRDLVRGLREPWRSIGASVPPIDDVYSRATRENRKLPRPYAVTTVLYPTEASLACASEVAKKGEAHTATLKGDAGKVGAERDDPRWEVKRLSPSLQPSAKVIEVWIAPTWAEGAVPTASAR